MKKFFKIAGIIFLVVLCIITAGYFYVVNNAESIIQDYVKRQTNGKYILEIKKINFNPWKLHLLVLQPHMYNSDTISDPTTYDIKVDRLVLDMSALKPLIFEKRIDIDTLSFMYPKIIVTKWKDQVKEKFSLPEQMGKVYSKLNNLTSTLNIKYCLIDSGAFTLVNKVQKDQLPVSITDYYLRIDNFKIDSSSRNDNRYLFNDRIKFYSSHQDIVSPDGKSRIKYSRLRINSNLQSIEIDSCYINRKSDQSGYHDFELFFDTLRLTHVDFERFTDSNLIKADSAVCINPNINLKTEVKANQQKKIKTEVKPTRDSVENTIKRLLGDIDLKYIGIVNAAISLQIKSGDKINSYASQRSDLSIEDITIINNPLIPVRLGSFYFGIKGYKAFNSDSTYAFSFAGIFFRNSTINLSNFSIGPTLKNMDTVNRKEIKMQSLEIRNLYWQDLFLHKKLAAAEVTMVSPEINLTSPQKSSATKVKHSSIYQSFNKISDKISIDILKIRDANMNVYSGEKNHFVLKNVNTEIGFDRLIQSGTINDFIESASDISFEDGFIKAGNKVIELQNGVFRRMDKSLLVSRLDFRDFISQTNAKLEDVRIENFSLDSNNLLEVGTLYWGKANISIYSTGKNKNPTAAKASPQKPIQLSLANLSGLNTSLMINSKGMKAGLFLDEMRTSHIAFNGVGKPELKDLYLKGRDLFYNKDSLQLAVQRFDISDQKLSSLQNIQVQINHKGTPDLISSPKISFLPSIRSFLQGENAVSDIVLEKPVIDFHFSKNNSKENPGKRKGNLPILKINQFSLVNPVFARLPDALAGKVDISNLESKIDLKGIQSEAHLLSIDEINMSMGELSAKTDKLLVSVKDSGHLNMQLKDIRYSIQPDSSKPFWSVGLSFLRSKHVRLVTKQDDSVKARINLQSLDLEDVVLQSGSTLNIRNILSGNQNLSIKNGNIFIANATNTISILGFGYGHLNKTLFFDSLAYRPIEDRELFNRQNQFQKDYFLWSLGKVSVSGINPERYFKDSVVYARKIEISQPQLQVYKDKRLPEKTGIYKPLPTAIINKIKPKIQVDSINIYQGDITYEEVNDKTLLEGKVHFSQTNVAVSGFKTFNINTEDSLRLQVRSRLQDSIALSLRFHESYYDSLNGFLLAVRISPFNLQALNPILQPFASAKIKRGWLDTLQMNATGREYIARGKMNMYYHKLKIQYLNNGDENSKTLKTRLINFAANTLILRKNRKKGYGEVFTERMREKGFLNYWIKMIISGAISSTGVKSNKKQEKTYNKSLERLNVPEIEEVNF